MKIQNVNQFFKRVVDAAMDWTYHGVKVFPLLTGIMKVNDIIAEGEYSMRRPMMGWSGDKLRLLMEKLMQKGGWFDKLLLHPSKPTLKVKVTCPSYDPSCMITEIILVDDSKHPYYDRLKKTGQELKSLLDICMKVSPSQGDIDSFKQRATSWGEHLLAIDPTYTLINYEHYLVCHAWELMEKVGSLGVNSSIVCEALNAIWKDTAEPHHTPQSGPTSEPSFNLVCSQSNPAKLLRLK